MSREPLPSGHVLLPGGKRAGSAYQIVKAIGSGGFGITYEAIKLPSTNGPDRGAALWLEPMARVAVKEFYPDDIAHKFNGKVQATDDDGAAEMFDQALHRFRREAERLFFLTQLRTLRASLDSPLANATDAGLVADIRKFVTSSDMANARTTALSHQLVERLKGPMAEAAKLTLERSPLPTVYDYFNTATTAYYVMEYLSGGTLKDRLRARRREFGTETVALGESSYRVTQPWGEGDIRHFADRALTALDELHSGIPGQQLVHCDLKPGNIMYRTIASTEPVLIDFGLARNVAGETSRSIVGGTSGYAPIEIDVDHRRHSSSMGKREADGAKVGPWTDIYGLAVILRVMATGIDGVAVPSAYHRSIGLQLHKADPLRSIPGYPRSLTARLIRGIDAGLAIEPSQRPQSVGDWRGLLGIAEEAPVGPINTRRDEHPRDDEVEIDDWNPDTSDDPRDDKTRTSFDRPLVDHQADPGSDIDLSDLDSGYKQSGLALNSNVIIAGCLLLALALAAFFLFQQISPDSPDEAGDAASDVIVESADATAEGDAEPAMEESASIEADRTADDDGSVQEADPRTNDRGPAEIARDESAPVIERAPPQPEPIRVASQTRRFAALGITVQTITDPSRLAEWRNQGLDPADPVRVTNVDSAARLSSNAVRINDVFISDCNGQSVLAALETAERNRVSCIKSESERFVRFN